MSNSGFPEEILLKIAFNIYHYDTLINFIKAFPHLKDTLLEDIGFFSLSKVAEKSKDSPNGNLDDFYQYYKNPTPFFSKWFEKNFGKIENLNYYPCLLPRFKHSRENLSQTRNGSSYIGSYGIGLFQSKLNRCICSVSNDLSRIYGYPEERGRTESGNYCSNFLYSKMTALSNFFLGTIIHKYKLYCINNNPSEINKSINSEIQEKNKGPKFIDTSLSFTGLREFKYFDYTGTFRDEILKIAQFKKFRFFILILNIPTSSIEYDIMLILLHFRDAYSKNQNNQGAVPFNIISYKSNDSDVPYQLLDSGNCLTNNHISLLDQISKLQITRTLPHEITFDFFDLKKNHFELKPTQASRDAMCYNFQRAEMYHWLQNSSLSDIPGLVSFQAIFSRNIEELYKKTTFDLGPFSYTHTQKENKFNVKDDIERFQPSASTFRSLDNFDKKFNLEGLQKIYDELFTRKQGEIQELIDRIPEYESTRSYITFLYKWREKSDEDIEVRQKRLELIWRRIDLFKEFLYNLPWVRDEILEPSFQVKFNLFQKRN